MRTVVAPPEPHTPPSSSLPRSAHGTRTHTMVSHATTKCKSVPMAWAGASAAAWVCMVQTPPKHRPSPLSSHQEWRNRGGGAGAAAVRVHLAVCESTMSAAGLNQRGVRERAVDGAGHCMPWRVCHGVGSTHGRTKNNLGAAAPGGRRAPRYAPPPARLVDGRAPRADAVCTSSAYTSQHAGCGPGRGVHNPGLRGSGPPN